MCGVGNTSSFCNLKKSIFVWFRVPIAPHSNPVAYSRGSEYRDEAEQEEKV
jgi:hypothetical protein